MCNRTWERGTWQTHWSLLLIIPGVWHSSSKLATAMTLPALPTHISPLTRCRLTQLASGASIQLHCKGSMWLLCTKNGYKHTYTRINSCWALYSGLPHCQFLSHFRSAFITVTLQGLCFKPRCVWEVRGTHSWKRAHFLLFLLQALLQHYRSWLIFLVRSHRICV